jgi:hypothetical protein
MSHFDDDRLPAGAPIPPTQFEKWNEDTSTLWVVCSLSRRFVKDFANKLEFEHYPPNDPALSARLTVVIHYFMGGPFVIFGVPLAERSRVELVCKQLNLRLADGFPWAVKRKQVVMLAASRTPEKGARIFDLHSRRTYTLQPNYGDRPAEPVMAEVFDPDALNAAFNPLMRRMMAKYARRN